MRERLLLNIIQLTSVGIVATVPLTLLDLPAAFINFHAFFAWSRALSVTSELRNVTPNMSSWKRSPS